MNAETVQKAWMDGYNAGLAEAASRQSRSKALLAALIYHEGRAETAEVYGRLHQEAEMREHWQEQRNRHYEMARSIRQAANDNNDASAAPAGTVGGVVGGLNQEGNR